MPDNERDYSLRWLVRQLDRMTEEIQAARRENRPVVLPAPGRNPQLRLVTDDSDA